MPPATRSPLRRGAIRAALVLCAALGSGAAASGQRPVRADPLPRAPSPEARDLLALSGTHRDNPAAGVPDPVQLRFAMPLQHLGIDLHARAFAAGVPPDLDPSRWRGVLVYVAGGDAVPSWLTPWIARQARRVRVLLIGDLTPLRTAAPAALDDLLTTCGLTWREGFSDDPFRIELELGDRRRTCFEATPVAERRHQGPAAVDPRHDVWVTTRDRRRPSDERHPVVTGSFGGLALHPWVLADDHEFPPAARWHLDPFAFFTAALGLAGLPVPEPCVRHGRRRFFFHVDGGGFESHSTVVPGQISAEVFRDRVVDAHRIPITVGFVVAGLTASIDPDEPTRGMRVAREILDRPWVTPASSGVLQLLDWRRERDREVTTSPLFRTGLEGYRPGPLAEVRESIRFVDRFLAAADRPCRTVLWSGFANPDAATLAEVRRLDALAINGGAFRFDRSVPTLTAVPPLSRRIGADALQIHAGSASELLFGGFRDRLPGVFRHVDETLRRTGTPRVLKPANVHAHFDSAERPARLAALLELLQTWAFDERTCVDDLRNYVLAVDEAVRRCEVRRLPSVVSIDGVGYCGFELRGFRHCTTARIDGPTPPIDWRHSRGIVGARRIGAALYLDVATDPARIVWRADTTAAPHLLEADHPCTGIQRTATGLRLRSTAVEGFARTLVFAGLPPAAAVDLRLAGVLRHRRAGADGRLEVRFDGRGTVEVSVEVRQ